jgi:hypothetical protein
MGAVATAIAATTRGIESRHFDLYISASRFLQLTAYAGG